MGVAVVRLGLHFGLSGWGGIGEVRGCLGAAAPRVAGGWWAGPKGQPVSKDDEEAAGDGDSDFESESTR
jgi:hypothetical protein